MNTPSKSPTSSPEAQHWKQTICACIWGHRYEIAAALFFILFAPTFDASIREIDRNLLEHPLITWGHGNRVGLSAEGKRTLAGPEALHKASARLPEGNFDNEEWTATANR